MTIAKSAILAPFIVLPLLAGCASTTETAEKAPRGIAKFADDPRLGPEADRICFASSIDSFRHETRDTVVLKARANDYYLVEVTGGCTNLRHAQRIGVDPAGGNCLRRNDALIVSENLFGGSDTGLDPQRCLIRAIHEWDDDAEEEIVEEG